MVTVKDFINKVQKEKRIGISGLSEGLCTLGEIQEIRAGKIECDFLLFSVLLQRMGESPDKLEYIFSWQEYRWERIRKQMMLCIFRGRMEWAEYSIGLYEREMCSHGAVHLMFVYRMRAMAAYWILKNPKKAQEWLVLALNTTFPKWAKENWNGCRVSVMELENVLAFVRVRYEQGELEEALLERCGSYIQEYVTDGEEHAKIYAKYAWMVAECRMHSCVLRANRQEQMDDPIGTQVLGLCEAALDELRCYSIEYFMRPLLKSIFECCQRLGAYGEEVLRRQEYPKYYHALVQVHQEYGVPYLPQDSIFWNCFQKMYHLESEIFRAERQVRGMTQEEVAEGIYAEPKTLRAVENDRSSPHHANFRRLMEKFGIHKDRRMGVILTDSVEALRLHKQIQGHISRHEYDDALPLLLQMERKLDMQITENLQTVRGIRSLIEMNQAERGPEELLKEEWELLNMTYHLLPEELKDLGEIAVVKKQKRGRPKKGKRTKAHGYRVPFKAEADILNHIAILLKKTGKMEDALRLWEWLVAGFEQSVIGVEYRYFSYSLLLGNLAKNKESLEDGIKVLRYDLGCGKLGGLGRDYMTIACAMLDDSSNREQCKKMVRDCYYLSKLSYHLRNQKIVKEFFLKEFGEDIEKN